MPKSLFHKLENELAKEVKQLGAVSCTFYVEDPWWPGELRLALMPGVKYREPMQGFLIPGVSKQAVIAGKSMALFADSEKEWHANTSSEAQVLLALVKKHRFYGNFVEREGIKSSVRLICRQKGKVKAVLFVNFLEPLSAVSSSLKAKLQHIFEQLTDQHLPFLQTTLRTEDPFPLKPLLKVLQLADKSGDESFENSLNKVLRSAMAVAQLTSKKGVGTTHVYDPRKRVLRLLKIEGKHDPAFRDKYQEINVDKGYGLVSWVALRRSELVIDDILKSEYRKIYVPTRRDIRSTLTVPILTVDERLVGVINLESTQAKAFKPQVVRAVWCMANQGASRYRISTMVQSLLRICSDAPNRSGKLGEPRPLDDLAELVREYQLAYMCNIWHADTGGAESAFKAVGITDEKWACVGEPRTKGEGWSHHVLRTKKPVLVSNIESKKRFVVEIWDGPAYRWKRALKKGRPASLNELVPTSNIREELGMPIVAKKQCIGVVWLKYLGDGEAPRSREAMESLSGFVGEIAMVLVCLYKQEEQQLKSANEAMRTLLTSLQHDPVGRICEKLFVDIRDVLAHNDKKYITLTFSSVAVWQSLLALQNTYIASLRWRAEDLRTNIEMKMEDLHLQELVEDVISVADLLHPEPYCKCRIQKDLTIHGDPDWLKLLLFNLIRNAKQATASKDVGKPVVISAFPSIVRGKHHLCVVVDDAAGGFKGRQPEELFSLEGRHSSRGFGLPLCSKIIDAHKGAMYGPQRNKRGGSAIGFILRER